MSKGPLVQNDSLNKRYLAKLAATLAGLGINLVLQAIIPRGLGPKAYGDFNFLSTFFLPLMTFLTFSSNLGFYTKLSQRQDEFGLISFYFKLSGLAALMLLAFVSLCQVGGWTGFFWPDQALPYVYMGALWALFTWVAMLMVNIGDAYGLTVSTEMARIVQKVVGLSLVLLLFLSGRLSLATFFCYHYIVLALLSLVIAYILAKNGRSLLQSWRLSRRQVAGYVKEFYAYSHPLFWYAVIGMVVSIFDRWLLQRFSGSVQQGFFGLSYQIGAACFLFTASMTSLITREFSIAYRDNDIPQMARLFRRYVPLLYSIAAFFGCFICINAQTVTLIFGGGKFAGAVLPVMIMALYPIHQTYGQLSGSIFFATGNTKAYRNIGVGSNLAGLVAVYFILAPPEMGGLGLGANGLAIKFVAIQFVAVNVQLFFNARLLKLNFKRYLAHQLVSLGALLGLAWLVDAALGRVEALATAHLARFFVAGVIYSAAALALAWRLPRLFGLQPGDAGKLWELGRGFLARRGGRA